MKKALLTLCLISFINPSCILAATDELSRELRIQKLEERVKELIGDNEQLKHKLALAEKNQTVDEPVADTSATAPDPVSPAKKEHSLNFGSGPMALEEYDKIQEVLQNGEYAKAEKMLKKFIKQFADSDLIVSAKYWLAETYYQRTKYGQAAPQYAEAYSDYSELSKKGHSRAALKGPEILFKLAKSLHNLGKKDEAKATLQQLQKEFKNLPPTLRIEVNTLKKELGK